MKPKDLAELAAEVERLRAAIVAWYRAHEIDTTATDEEGINADLALERIARAAIRGEDA